jgi:hypothetical protein
MGKGNNNSIEGEGASEMIYDTKGINRNRKSNKCR